MKRGPLLSWDVYSEYIHKFIKSLRKKQEIETLNRFQSRFNWDFQVEETLFKNEYKAIVVTDKNQKIIWVNDGFKEMTGYSLSSIKDKSPRILQGDKTSKETLQDIRNHLAQDIICETSMINYRKDGSEYLCEIKIFPIQNSNNEVAYYLALENEAMLN